MKVIKSATSLVRQPIGRRTLLFFGGGGRLYMAHATSISIHFYLAAKQKALPSWIYHNIFFWLENFPLFLTPIDAAARCFEPSQPQYIPVTIGTISPIKLREERDAPSSLLRKKEKKEKEEKTRY